ncbi:RimK/LysX family protein [Congregibacter variabilis]|uniref:RimK/LysX family protein n=1 Tax=Congregibacter variabilis TaxID=3081200 RepID=A0ABZ0I3N7_9GAMM|nr:RimK/LysX family protein [Congregibacter sp. IMCC43200]
MMIRYRNLLLGSSLVFLAACQTAAPIEEAPAAPECPIVEPAECPVCEVQQCPDQAPPELSPVVCPAIPQNTCAVEDGLRSRYPLIGEQEWALVEPGDLVLEARIDTGAETSSIHAENIQLLEKDSKRWVRFTVKDPDSDREIQLERRLHRRILVKQTGSDDYDRRYVVRMWITLGDTRTWLDVSLSDRDDFDFPLLIGRNMLMDAFAVDVSQHHTLPKPAPSASKQDPQ